MNDKKAYDKARYLKIKNKEWEFNHEPPKVLSKIQEQILIGGLLGDLSLYQYKKQINSGIVINRAIKDKGYLEYQLGIFKEFCPTGIKIRDTFDKRTNKIYTGCCLRSQVAEVFNLYKQKWYPEGIKIVPRDLKLTSLICAIWFCDDGSITYTGPNKTGRRISLYADSFIKEDCIFLQSALSNAIDANINMTRKKSMKDESKGFYLYIDRKLDIIKFINYIRESFPHSMNRKSDRWEGLI